MSAPFSVILADPPWWYAQRAPHAKTRFGGGAAGTYPLMRDQEILDLGPLVSAVAAPDAVLLLWATYPRLPLCMDVLKAWGFAYSTVGFTWIKTYSKKGTDFRGGGFWTAANPEIVLLGFRGTPLPHANLIEGVVREPHPRDHGKGKKIIHSRKPDTVRRRIEAMFGDVPRLEMFAREADPGWVSIGNGLSGRDIRDELADLAPPSSLPILQAIAEASA